MVLLKTMKLILKSILKTNKPDQPINEFSYGIFGENLTFSRSDFNNIKANDILMLTNHLQEHQSLFPIHATRLCSAHTRHYRRVEAISINGDINIFGKGSYSLL